MVVKSVSRKHIVEMKPGDIKCFIVPNVKTIYTARTVVSQVSRLTGYLYKTKTDFDNLEFTVRCISKSTQHESI